MFEDSKYLLDSVFFFGCPVSTPVFFFSEASQNLSNFESLREGHNFSLLSHVLINLAIHSASATSVFLPVTFLIRAHLPKSIAIKELLQDIVYRFSSRTPVLSIAMWVTAVLLKALLMKMTRSSSSQENLGLFRSQP